MGIINSVFFLLLMMLIAVCLICLVLIIILSISFANRVSQKLHDQLQEYHQQLHLPEDKKYKPDKNNIIGPFYTWDELRLYFVSSNVEPGTILLLDSLGEKKYFKVKSDCEIDEIRFEEN